MITTGIDSATTPLAKPRLVRLGRWKELALIEVHGDVDGDAWEEVTRLTRLLESNESVRAILLHIDSTAAEWPHRAARDVANVLQRIRKQPKNVSAFVERAIGASYYLAACCGPIIAAPAARIGMFGTGDEALTAAFHCDVIDVRPYVTVKPGGFESLYDQVVSGEQAETLRLVDGLCPTIERLLAGMFTNARVAVVEGQN